MIKKQSFLLGILFSILAGTILNAQVFELEVNPNKPGAYKTIRNAIGRIPSTTGDRVLIFIANGTYIEKLTLTRANVALIGESRDGVIITNGDHANDGTHGTSDSYTFWVDADDVYLENLTIVNSAGNVGQAVALRTDGNQQVFKNCKLLGFQDTYYAHSGMTYLQDCFVEGATDFIFGDATTVLNNCTINCVNGGQYITAPADSKLTSTMGDGTTMIHGLLFKDCDITADADVSANSYYLGRPLQPNSSSVYMNCTVGDHIRSVGWSDWDNENHLSAYFAEYKSVDTDGELVDTTSRVEWSYQIPDSIAEDYYNLEYFLTKESVSWDPTPITVALEAPDNLSIASSAYHFTWDAVDDAKGYIILRNDSTIGFSETNDYADVTMLTSIANTYTVKSVTVDGALSPKSSEYTIAASSVHDLVNNSNNIIKQISRHIIEFTEPVSIKIYSLSGSILVESKCMRYYNLNGINPGVYLIQAKTNNNETLTKKILIQ